MQMGRLNFVLFLIHVGQHVSIASEDLMPGPQSLNYSQAVKWCSVRTNKWGLPEKPADVIVDEINKLKLSTVWLAANKKSGECMVTNSTLHYIRVPCNSRHHFLCKKISPKCIDTKDIIIFCLIAIIALGTCAILVRLMKRRICRCSFPDRDFLNTGAGRWVFEPVVKTSPVLREPSADKLEENELPHSTSSGSITKANISRPLPVEDSSDSQHCYQDIPVDPTTRYVEMRMPADNSTDTYVPPLPSSPAPPRPPANPPIKRSARPKTVIGTPRRKLGNNRVSAIVQQLSGN